MKGDDVLFLHVWFEHVFAEFLKQLCADGLVRDDQVQVGEELFERVRVIAEQVRCPIVWRRRYARRGYFRDGFAWPDAVSGTPHVHRQCGAGEVVGGDDGGDAV